MRFEEGDETIERLCNSTSTEKREPQIGLPHGEQPLNESLIFEHEIDKIDVFNTASFLQKFIER